MKNIMTVAALVSVAALTAHADVLLTYDMSNALSLQQNTAGYANVRNDGKLCLG